MFEQRFMDGTPAPPEYTEKVGELVAAACEAEEQVGIDALEEASNAMH